MIYYVTCPECEYGIRRVADSDEAVIGQKVRCDECRHEFTAESRGTVGMADADGVLDMFVDLRQQVERRRADRVRARLMGRR